MPINLYILGPQRPSENLSEIVQSHLSSGQLSLQGGPISVITSGWRHDEGEIQPLREAIPLPLLSLPLYHWFDELGRVEKELAKQHKSRQRLIKQYKKFYRRRLQNGLHLWRSLEDLSQKEILEKEILEKEISISRDLHQNVPYGFELEEICSDVRRCDEDVLNRLRQIRDLYPDLQNPWTHPSAQPYHQRIKEILDSSQALFIAGGHVAILRNRMNFFGLHHVIRDFLMSGKPIYSWSAGAMVLSEKIVLYYDNPPQGEGHPEILDEGLNIFRNMIMFPHAHERLDLNDTNRIKKLAKRFAPQLCIGLESNAYLHFDGSTIHDLGPERSSFVMTADGLLKSLNDS